MDYPSESPSAEALTTTFSAETVSYTASDEFKNEATVTQPSPHNLGNFSASAPRASLDMYMCNQ